MYDVARNAVPCATTWRCHFPTMAIAEYRGLAMATGCSEHGFLVEEIGGTKGVPDVVDHIPSPRLAAYVHAVRGYRPQPGGWARLRLVPSTRMKIDISLGEPPELADSGAAPRAAVYGLRTRPTTLTRFDGPSINVDLTPPGAYGLLAVPLWKVTDMVIDLVDAVGHEADRIVPRLTEVTGWPERMALLDDALTAWTETGPRPAPQVLRAWYRLRHSHGRIPIERLAAEVGWTRRHLVNQFRTQIGSTPKAAARVIRFQHGLHLLRLPGPRRSLAELAQTVGYSDQAHLTREFGSLADVTPAQSGTVVPISSRFKA